MTDPNISRTQNEQQAENSTAVNRKSRIATPIVSFVAGLAVAGIIAGGMIPKIGGMADAIYQGVHEAVIIDGRVPHSILLELFSNRGSGTRFYRRSHQE